ncbi:MAG: fused MFS/spermidine synthase [Gemmataceae bacterium]
MKSIQLPALFAATLFVASGLLFLIEPMIARMVLPYWGGTSSVWTTCMLFFQGTLLLGYIYAHAVPERLGMRRHAVMHLFFMCALMLLLPVSAGLAPTMARWSYSVLGLLLTLTFAVGLPFFVLSASGPLLQRWFSSTGHSTSGDPYYLFAASNLGSMLALLSYPFEIEPAYTLDRQSRWWTAGYALLVLLTAGCVYFLKPDAGPSQEENALEAATHKHAPTWKERGWWVLLAAIPASLMLSVTMYLTTDLAAIPLLWVVPLAIYLLTFVIASMIPRFLARGPLAHALPLVVLILVISLLSEATEPLWLIMVVHLVGLFWIGLVCHGEVFRTRPAARWLTEFYLWLGLGGFLGGAFNALLAPMIFTSQLEYPLVLTLLSFQPLRNPPRAKKRKKQQEAEEEIIEELEVIPEEAPAPVAANAAAQVTPAANAVANVPAKPPIANVPAANTPARPPASSVPARPVVAPAANSQARPPAANLPSTPAQTPVANAPGSPPRPPAANAGVPQRTPAANAPAAGQTAAAKAQGTPAPTPVANAPGSPPRPPAANAGVPQRTPVANAPAAGQTAAAKAQGAPVQPPVANAPGSPPVPTPVANAPGSPPPRPAVANAPGAPPGPPVANASRPAATAPAPSASASAPAAGAPPQEGEKIDIIEEVLDEADDDRDPDDEDLPVLEDVSEPLLSKMIWFALTTANRLLNKEPPPEGWHKTLAESPLVRYGQGPLLLAIVMVILSAVARYKELPPGPSSNGLTLAIPALICFFFVDNARQFGLGIVTLLLFASTFHGLHGTVEYRTRSFFGIHSVTYDSNKKLRALIHGNTVHGRQSLDERYQKEPLTYYHPSGPMGRFFQDALKNDKRLDRVALVGMGTGSLAYYGKAGQHWTFFEIDPSVVHIARDTGLFTFIKDSAAKIDVVVGDARLELAHSPDKFGLIVLDAFSSDAIPTHLLTREALAGYRAKLTENGMLAFHVSNRYLDLVPLLQNLAAQAQPPLHCLVWPQVEIEDDLRARGKEPSTWVVLTPNKKDIDLLARSGLWQLRPGDPKGTIWTDSGAIDLLKVWRKEEPK